MRLRAVGRPLDQTLVSTTYARRLHEASQLHLPRIGAVTMMDAPPLAREGLHGLSFVHRCRRLLLLHLPRRWVPGLHHLATPFRDNPSDRLLSLK